VGFEVHLQPFAEQDLGEAYDWAARHAPETASCWLRRFQEAIQSLSSNPERCGFAPERTKLKYELRQLLFGHKPNVFRVIFVIEEGAVWVLRIRRASRRFLRRSDLGI
jgi:plasmid stabilization system protein ParE